MTDKKHSVHTGGSELNPKPGMENIHPIGNYSPASIPDPTIIKFGIPDNCSSMTEAITHARMQARGDPVIVYFGPNAKFYGRNLANSGNTLFVFMDGDMPSLNSIGTPKIIERDVKTSNWRRMAIGGTNTTRITCTIIYPYNNDPVHRFHPPFELGGNQHVKKQDFISKSSRILNSY